MTAYQRAALGCRLAALAAAGSGAAVASRQEWLPAVVILWIGLLLVFVGGRCQRAHLSVRAKHELAERAARTDAAVLAMPVPCCSFWRHTDGEAHGPDCTRTAAVQHDYRLDPGTAAAFDAIAAHFDDRRSA